MDENYLYRTPASKQTQYYYYDTKPDPNKEYAMRFDDMVSMGFMTTIKPDNSRKRGVEISAGVDIDELYQYMMRERLFRYSTKIMKLRDSSDI